MTVNWCIWCNESPAGGFIIEDLCIQCEKRFAELSGQDKTYAENDIERCRILGAKKTEVRA